MTPDIQQGGADVVSRSEFDQHRVQVSRDFESLSDVVREAQRSNDRTMNQIRADIKEITATTGRPQWHAISVGIAVFSFVLGVVFAVYEHGDSKLQAALTQLADERFSSVYVQMREMHQRVDIAEQWQDDHADIERKRWGSKE